MKQDESKSLTRRHFKRLCRVILDKEDSPPSEGQETRFGRFVLKSEVGRGSFGVVWRAHDPTMDRDVALKILPPASRDQDHGRLLREVRAAARLNHPGVVSVYEMGEVEGRPFIVMDLVEGKPLDPSLKLKKRKFIEIMVRLAETLHYAHEQGLVHRDIKPSNILIRNDGRPVLVDFGLARTIGRDERVTMTGAIFGTPAYMSPEQAGGTPGEIDARSDLYSLGVVLYELLGGQLPHQGNTPYEITQAILNDDPPRLRTLNPKIPLELEAITFMAMSRSRDQRYASAGELAEDLKAFLKGGLVRARPVSSFRRFFHRLRQRPLVPALAVGACALISLGIWVGSRFGDEAHVQIPSREKLPERINAGGGGKRLTFLPGLHKAVFATLEGIPGPQVSQLRTGIEALIAESPKDLIGYISLAQLDLLEGKREEALGRFDQAGKAGAPVAETLSAKCGFLIALGGPYLLEETTGRIDLASLTSDDDFRHALKDLQNLGDSPFLAAFENAMSGGMEKMGPPKPPEGGGRGNRQFPPEMQLLRSITLFNSRRYPDVISHLQVLRREYPTPSFGAILALASLVNGRVADARRTLDEFSRLPIPPGDDFTYLRALVSLEQERWEECGADLDLLPDSLVRTYTRGLLAVGRDDKPGAKGLFEACGDYAPAHWQLACLEARSDPKSAISHLEKAVNGMGGLEMRDHVGKPSRGLRPFVRTAIPFFTIDRQVLEKAPPLRPLRDNPRTRDRFWKILGR